MDQKRISYCIEKCKFDLKTSTEINQLFRDYLIDKVLPDYTNVFFLGDSVLDNFMWLKNPKQNLTWQMNQKIIGKNTNNYMFAVNKTKTNNILEGKKPDFRHQEGRKKYNLEQYPTNYKEKVYPLKLIKEHINPKRKNYAVLSIGHNDIRVYPQLSSKGWEKIWTKMNNNYTNNYEKIVKKLSKMNLTGIILVSVYLPYIIFEKYFKQIYKILEKSKELLFKIARKFNLPVIDLSKSFNNKNPKHYGKIENSINPIEPSNISSMFISNLVTYVINDFDFKSNVSKIYSGQNINNITCVNNIEVKEQIKSPTKPEPIVSDLPIDLRKIIYEYAKPGYIFRNITFFSDESNEFSTKEEAYNMLLKDIQIEEDNIELLKEYVEYADYYSVFLLDIDHKHFYTGSSDYLNYELYADDDFNEVKREILDGRFLVEIGEFGFKIMAILPNDETLENNNKKLIKLKNHIIKNFKVSDWEY